MLTQNERTQVYGFGKSVAPKARWKAHTNYAKATDIFNDYSAPENAIVTAEQILENMKSSKIGREYISIAENLPERIKLDYATNKPNVYGENYHNDIIIYMKSNPTAERAARTVIHECTHQRYGIGESQWAECVCIAHELMHKYNRDYLTVAEKRRIIKAVKEVYGEYNWRKGGLMYGRKKKHT